MTQSKFLSSFFFTLLLVSSWAGAEQLASDVDAAQAVAEPVSSEATAAVPAEPEANAADQLAAVEAKPEPLATGSVARSAFATDIQDHEPVDQISSLNNDSNNVYFFTELADLQGQKAIHRWEFNGEVMAEVPFNVGGNRWRVWSTKNLNSDWTGSWKVSVINGSGDVIAVQSLQYEVAPEQPAVAEAPAVEQMPASEEAPAMESETPIADTEVDLTTDESAPAEAQ